MLTSSFKVTFDPWSECIKESTYADKILVIMSTMQMWCNKGEEEEEETGSRELRNVGKRSLDCHGHFDVVCWICCLFILLNKCKMEGLARPSSTLPYQDRWWCDMVHPTRCCHFNSVAHLVWAQNYTSFLYHAKWHQVLDNVLHSKCLYSQIFNKKLFTWNLSHH